MVGFKFSIGNLAKEKIICEDSNVIKELEMVSESAIQR